MTQATFCAAHTPPDEDIAEQLTMMPMLECCVCGSMSSDRRVLRLKNRLRRAILQVSPEVLAELLQLPSGAHIDGVQAPVDRPGALELRIVGAGWPTEPGRLIPSTTAMITRMHGEDGAVKRLTIDWRLP